jgi:hypothetical protein
MAYKLNPKLIKTGDPVFVTQCTDFAELFNSLDEDTGVKIFRKMIQTVKQQSKSLDAKFNSDPTKMREYGLDDECPAYFGSFGEWIAYELLTYYSDHFNVESVKMTDAIGSTKQDNGVDGFARSSRTTINKRNKRKTVANAPVYIQVKATALTGTKIFQANDGSRITNYVANAATYNHGEEFRNKERYILIHFGKDIGYRLDAMTNKKLEVYNFYDLAKLITRPFLNHLRKRVGLPTVDLPEVKASEEDYNLDSVDRAERTMKDLRDRNTELENRIKALEAALRVNVNEPKDDTLYYWG